MDLRLGRARPMEGMGDHGEPDLLAQRLGQQPSLVVATFPLPAGMERHWDQAIAGHKITWPGARHQRAERLGQIALSFVFQAVDCGPQRATEHGRGADCGQWRRFAVAEGA